MLTRPEPQSFTRFTISVAVFLAIAALLLPGLVLRETNVLQVSQRELAGLTPTGRAELKRRQEIARGAGYAAPFIGLAFLACAVGLIWYGLPRLKEQEEDEKKRSFAELSKLLLDIRQQSESEREEGLRADVEEEQAHVGEAASSDGQSAEETVRVVEEDAQPPQAQQLAVDQPEASEPQRTPSPGLRDRMRLARAVEDQTLARIGRLVGPGYELQTNVSIQAAVRLQLDGLLLNRDGDGPDILIEIKLSSPAAMRKSMANRLMEQAGKLMAYRDFIKRPAALWLILVSDESVPATTLARIAGQAPKFERLRVTAIDMENLDRLQLPDFD